MKKKLILKILIGIVVLILLVQGVTVLILEPWVARKVQTLLNNPTSRIIYKIDDVDISLLTFGIKFEKITLYTHAGEGIENCQIGEISLVDIKGIHLFKALFSKEWKVDALTVTDCIFSDQYPLSHRNLHPFTPPANIFVENVNLDHLELSFQDSATSKSYLFHNSQLIMHNFNLLKGEKLVNFTSENFEFQTPQLAVTSPNGMYTFIADTVMYSALSEILKISSFKIQPNYKGYDFTSREKYQTDRVEATFSNNQVFGFCAEDYIRDGNIICTDIEIGQMAMDIFRDRRKPFEHKLKPVFQDILLEYPHRIDIDSMHFGSGSIKYTEHAEGANHPGSITFREITGSIISFSNDSLRKNRNDTLVLKAEAMIYGKSKLRLITTARLFQADKAFHMKGRLAPMNIKDLNPILEKNAFIYAHGKINSLDFNFTANKYKANGSVLFLYNDLGVTIKNKNTDDTTGAKEVILTRLANKAILDSNPLRHDEARTGIIDYKRDPEKMFFNYCLKSVISGMKESVRKASKKKKKDLKD
ncbi:MAG: hypothetical protein ABIQ02_11385 [Saprospiraceae bacterium]